MQEDNLMDELVKLVSEKTGISAEQARTAVTTVLGFLKYRLPAPIAGKLDGLLSGGGLPSDLSQGLGGLFDKK
jgi:hypothetical protein